LVHAQRSRFFFPSRRRHTTFSRDWSSDVCSSDLARSPTPCGRGTVRSPFEMPSGAEFRRRLVSSAAESSLSRRATNDRPRSDSQIGRASCREKVQLSLRGQKRTHETPTEQTNGQR